MATKAGPCETGTPERIHGCSNLTSGRHKVCCHPLLHVRRICLLVEWRNGAGDVKVGPRIWRGCLCTFGFWSKPRPRHCSSSSTCALPQKTNGACMGTIAHNE